MASKLSRRSKREAEKRSKTNLIAEPISAADQPAEEREEPLLGAQGALSDEKDEQDQVRAHRKRGNICSPVLPIRLCRL